MGIYDLEEIKFIDVLKTEDFWGWFVMGTMLAWLVISLLWGLFRLITGNDPDLNLIDKDTGNFIVFLALIIAGFKSYNSAYNNLYRERQRRIEEQREWEKED